MSFIEGVKWVAKRKLGTSYLLCKRYEASHRMGLWWCQMPFTVTIVWREPKDHSTDHY